MVREVMMTTVLPSVCVSVTRRAASNASHLAAVAPSHPCSTFVPSRLVCVHTLKHTETHRSSQKHWHTTTDIQTHKHTCTVAAIHLCSTFVLLRLVCLHISKHIETRIDIQTHKHTCTFAPINICSTFALFRLVDAHIETHTYTRTKTQTQTHENTYRHTPQYQCIDIHRHTHPFSFAPLRLRHLYTCIYLTQTHRPQILLHTF